MITGRREQDSQLFQAKYVFIILCNFYEYIGNYVKLNHKVAGPVAKVFVKSP